MAVHETFAERFLSPEKRMNRLRFFVSVIILIIIQFIITFTVPIFISLNPYHTQILANALMVILLYPRTIISIKRFHDMNVGGTFMGTLIVISCVPIVIGCLVTLVPSMQETLYMDNPMLPSTMIMFGANMISSVVTLIAGLFLLFKKGTEGDNQYGSDPLGQGKTPFNPARYASNPLAKQAAAANPVHQTYSAFPDEVFEEAAQELHVNPDTLGSEDDGATPAPLESEIAHNAGVVGEDVKIAEGIHNDSAFNKTEASGADFDNIDGKPSSSTNSLM